MSKEARDLAAIEADYKAANARLDELRERQEQALAEALAAEDKVRVASVEMATSASEEATEQFHAATRRLAELRARTEAFECQVIPAASALVAQLGIEVSEAHRQAQNEAARELVRTQLLPAVAEFLAGMEAASLALHDIDAASTAVLRSGATLSEWQKDCLGPRSQNGIAFMVPTAIAQIVRRAPSRTASDHTYNSSVRAAFDFPAPTKES